MSCVCGKGLAVLIGVWLAAIILALVVPRDAEKVQTEHILDGTVFKRFVASTTAKVVKPTRERALSIIYPEPTATPAQPSTPKSFNGSFLASGVNLTSSFVQVALKQALRRMFRDEDSSISVGVSKVSSSNITIKSVSDSVLSKFSCTFHLCGKAARFNVDHFRKLLLYESKLIARISGIANDYGVNHFRRVLVVENISTDVAKYPCPAPVSKVVAGTPTFFIGSFLASGKNATVNYGFVDAALHDTLKKMFPNSASVVVTASSEHVSFAGSDDGSPIFSCIFSVCTAARFFDRAYFATLLKNESRGLVARHGVSVAVTHRPCQAEKDIPVSFGTLGNGSCYAHYLPVKTASHREACARECAFHPGCVVFSFGAGGCRISFCKEADAKGASKVSCGHSQGGAQTFRAQCATRHERNNEVFYLMGLQVFGVHVGCGHKYIPFPAASPLHCSQACDSKPHCKIFSFGKIFGCRLSACADSLSVDANMSCNAGVVGQCITESRENSYLYGLPGSHFPTIRQPSTTTRPAGNSGSNFGTIGICIVCVVVGGLLVAFGVTKLRPTSPPSSDKPLE